MTSSNDKPLVTVLPDAEEVTVAKPSLLAKIGRTVKTNKKTTIAVGGLIGLIGLGMVLGKKQDNAAVDPFDAGDVDSDSVEDQATPVTED